MTSTEATESIKPPETPSKSARREARLVLVLAREPDEDEDVTLDDPDAVAALVSVVEAAVIVILLCADTTARVTVDVLVPELVAAFTTSTAVAACVDVLVSAAVDEDTDLVALLDEDASF